MGRSAPSCFKIITCASDSIDRGDLEASETKGSSDKRGWSFRKRSPKHRVVNNTVISELPPSGNKEIQEPATVNYHVEANNSAILEKPSEMQCKDETPPLAASVKSKLSDIIAETDDPNKLDIDHNEYEESVFVIQAAIRGFLARRSLVKHKNVVKLQAAVRGHLVRSHAVGTLRCVQAIVKMQALVRARRARLSAQGSSPSILGKQNAGMKPDFTNPSIQKLLSNSFARQLMESTPKTKPLKIKCDPSRSDSTWKWLERWVSVSPTGIQQSLKPELRAETEDQEKDNQVENAIASTDYCESTDLTSTTVEPAVQSETEENSATYKSENFETQPHAEITPTSNPKENSDFPPNEALPSDLVCQMELNSISGKPELETEQPNNAPEQPETEGRKVVFGSRKASNPAFIAAQSKFEELTSSAKSVNSSNQDFGAESCAADTVSSVTDKRKEIEPAENSVPHNSRIQVGGSESGTELSISSTLDSPDPSEPLAVEHEQQSNALEEVTSNPKSNKKVDIEARVEPIIPNTVQPEKFDNGNGPDDEAFDSVLVADSSQVDQKFEQNSSVPAGVGPPETVDQVCKPSSPEASPRSHMTIPESQGTPSSQVSSSKAKKTKSDKNGSQQKRKSLSAGKRSPIKPSHDSGARSSFEKLPKEHNKTEEEPRDSSNTNNYLPSYMQATESAKAKAHASSGSPRSSPDVQEKDIFVKKRQSLPGANGRHGSPRIQRSKSQVPQNTKGGSTQPSQERKWQR